MRLAIIGLGMLGGSIAASAKDRLSKVEITAFDQNQAVLAYALNNGVIDHAANSIAEAVVAAEMIIIAAPIKAYRGIFRELKPYLQTHQIVTDVGSVKRLIVEVAQEELQEFMPQFVPGHPVAGSEKSGVQALSKSLFINCQVVLTPQASTKSWAIEKVQEFWKALGAAVNLMEAIQHDEYLAFTSHLPHVLSYAFAKTIVDNPKRDAILKNTGGSFADFTRIAASDPHLWSDIFLANQDFVLTAIENFQQSLERLRKALSCKDEIAVRGILNRINVNWHKLC